MEMKVLSTEKSAPEEQGHLLNIVKITAIDHDRAYAAVPPEMSKISKGMKVEEVVR
jgi:hypothetical protein